MDLYSLLLLLDGRLASCSSDNTIKIYDMDINYNCVITINTGHTNIVTYISQLGNNKIISLLKEKVGEDGKIIFADPYSEITVIDTDGNNLVENKYYSKLSEYFNATK